MYCRSCQPIALEKNPDAVRSRKRLKKPTPWLISGFAFCGHAMSSSTCRRCASVARDERLARSACRHSVSSQASPPRIAMLRVVARVLRRRAVKSMYSGTPASVALPERSSRGMMLSASMRTVRHSCGGEELRRVRGSRRRRSASLRARACADCACCARASAAARRSARAPSSAARRVTAFAGLGSRRARRRVATSSLSSLIVPPPCAAARCSRSCATTSARIVHVGFLSACETNGPPSATNRFFTSCAWQLRVHAPTSSDRCPCARRRARG